MKKATHTQNIFTTFRTTLLHTKIKKLRRCKCSIFEIRENKLNDLSCTSKTKRTSRSNILTCVNCICIHFSTIFYHKKEELKKIHVAVFPLLQWDARKISNIKTTCTKMWKNMSRHDQEVTVLHVPFVSFRLKNKNILRARKKWYPGVNTNKSTHMSEALTSLVLLSDLKVI